MYSPEFQGGRTKIVGQAFTVKFVPKSDHSAPLFSGTYVSKHISSDPTQLTMDHAPDRHGPRQPSSVHVSTNTPSQCGLWRPHEPSGSKAGSFGCRCRRQTSRSGRTSKFGHSSKCFVRICKTGSISLSVLPRCLVDL